MNVQTGIKAYQLEETSYRKWFQKYADWKTSKVIRLIIASKPQGATELYEADVPEKIIQERTGHRSLECLQMYEKTSEKQAVSNILSSSSQSMHETQVAKLNSCSQNITVNSTSVTPALLPKMNFSNCQVNINVNHPSLLQQHQLS